MPAVSTMILNSLVAIGEKAVEGATLSTAEQAFYLGKINSMLESWSLERTAVYAITQDTKALTAGTVSYTIGSGGSINVARPLKIVNAFTRNSSNYDFPIDIIGQPEYNAIKVKSTGNSYPTVLYYDTAYPLGTINLYPAPIAGLTLYLNSYKQLQSFANVSTALSLPPGYQRAIETNFSIECAPGLTSISPELAKIARDSLAAIRRMNAPEVISRLDTPIAGKTGSSILNGP